MSTTIIRATPGDIVRIGRLDCDLLVQGRNGWHPDQILGCELCDDRRGRLRIFTDNEIIAREAGAGMQMLLRDERRECSGDQYRPDHAIF